MGGSLFLESTTNLVLKSNMVVNGSLVITGSSSVDLGSQSTLFVEGIIKGFVSYTLSNIYHVSRSGNVVLSGNVQIQMNASKSAQITVKQCLNATGASLNLTITHDGTFFVLSHSFFSKSIGFDTVRTNM